jgi:hypothetical protein
VYELARYVADLAPSGGALLGSTRHDTTQPGSVVVSRASVSGALLVQASSFDSPIERFIATRAALASGFDWKYQPPVILRPLEGLVLRIRTAGVAGDSVALSAAYLEGTE